METVLPSGITLQRRDEPSTLGPEYGVPLADHVLERIALRWAGQTGNPPATVVLSEDELGWTMWAPGYRAAYSTFVDKVTGRITGFANPAFPDRQYREQLEYDDGLVPRPGFRGPEVDPPALTAEVSLRRGPDLLATGYGHNAKGAVPPALHPLVQARLDTIPARARVRGCERHAEMIAFSVAAGRGGSLADDLPGPAIGGRLDDVQVSTRLHRIRDAGDPLINDPSPRSCTTCREVLGEWPLPARSAAWRLALDRRKVHHRPPTDPASAIAEVVAIAGTGHRHEVFPAADDALRRYSACSGRRTCRARPSVPPRSSSTRAPRPSRRTR